MSKYTTEVRFICEQKAGLNSSAGFESVDEILEKSWDKILTTKCTIFDEEYRKPLFKKILKHYYTREIGAETVGLWQLWINRDLEEKLPYYNQLYSSTLLEFNPFNDVDLTTKENRTGKNTGNTTSSNTQTNSGSDLTERDIKDSGEDKTNGSAKTSGTDSNENHEINSGTDKVVNNGSYSTTHNEKSRFSDTPQGSISQIDLENNAYLTNATLNDGTLADNEHTDTDTTTHGKHVDITGSVTYGKQDTTATTTAYGKKVDDDSKTSYGKIVKDNGETTSSADSTEEYLQRVTGKRNGQSYSELLEAFRKTFLNIDMLLINDLEENFLGLW